MTDGPEHESDQREWYQEAEEALERVGVALRGAWEASRGARMSALESARRPPSNWVMPSSGVLPGHEGAGPKAAPARPATRRSRRRVGGESASRGEKHRTITHTVQVLTSRPETPFEVMGYLPPDGGGATG